MAAAPAVGRGGGGEALLREDGETEQKRQDRLVEEQVVLGWLRPSNRIF